MGRSPGYLSLVAQPEVDANGVVGTTTHYGRVPDTTATFTGYDQTFFGTPLPSVIGLGGRCQPMDIVW